MPLMQAQLTTERASRYLVQFCRHAAAMGGGAHAHLARRHGGTSAAVDVTAEWSDTEGVVTFRPWGSCRLTAVGDTLALTISAVDEDGLNQIRDIVTRDFGRFAQRQPPLSWQRPEPTSSSDAIPDPHDEDGGKQALRASPRSRSPRLRPVLLVLATLAVLGLHLGLVGSVVASSPWTGAATNLLVALVVLKVALLALGHRRLRRARLRTAARGR